MNSVILTKLNRRRNLQASPVILKCIYGRLVIHRSAKPGRQVRFLLDALNYNKMTIKEFKDNTVGISPNSDIVFFPDGAAEDNEGRPLLAGIGVFDMENHEFIYIGDIAVINEDSWIIL